MSRSLPVENPDDAIAAPIQSFSGSIDIYDPAMCCSTGVCGPSADPSLLVIARDLRWIEKHGGTVKRYGLSQEPDAFVREPRITGLMQAFGDKALPAVVVNGNVLTYGRYPSRAEIAAALSTDTDDGACGCSPGSKCA